MLKVSNAKCIRHLSRNALKASGMRNMIAVLAIALTTILFTAIFTIGASLKEGIEQSTFRQVGGYSHGEFKYLTQEEFEQLRQDPLIREWGVRRMLGMPAEEPFHKSHVEISYVDANAAKWMYCDPVEGRLPKEGTMEAATDLQVLKLLGVTPELGKEFTITFDVAGKETTQTFVLCGWWEYDAAIPVNHVLIPESRLDEVLAETGVNPADIGDEITGSRNLIIMFDNSYNIGQKLWQILYNNGYQPDSITGEMPIKTGVNWGYTGSLLSNNLDPMLVLGMIAILLLIGFTGYLIIYNIFRISVTNDIRFYGLLKTIGTTPGQLKRIIRQQALLLCILGIPLGLLGGWLVGCKLTPIVVAQLDTVHSTVSLSPVIFVGSALFSLLTVLISCAKPGRIAAKVSPIEAVRYTEESAGRKVKKRPGKGVSLLSMAKDNLGRSRSKTVITILSLSLSIVLLVTTVTFTNGFDMDKYLSKFVCTDFIVADAGYFQVTGDSFHADMALQSEVIDEITSREGITEGGRVYGKTSDVQEFITEEWFRTRYGSWYDQESIDILPTSLEREENGLIAEGAQIFGMEPYILDHLKVLEGDLSKLYEPGSRYIAAVYSEDDYGNPDMDRHFAKVGDTVTLRYMEALAQEGTGTIEAVEMIDGTVSNVKQQSNTQAAEYRDIEYEVAALVIVPHVLSYRRYAFDEYVLNAETFMQDTGTDCVMLYAFDVAEESTSAMEDFLADYTTNDRSMYDYEGKATYQAEFEGFRSMFLMMGSVLSFIVGLVGVLNFFNAILTGILTRKREFAVLQSIGMTGKQLKRMLVYEGLFYAVGSLALSVVLIVALSPVLAPMAENMFWFFTYQFTLAPILIVAPFFILLGCLIPLAVYRSMEKVTVVERLREVEG